jgi:regulator of nucleoside diphosphate kinase
MHATIQDERTLTELDFARLTKLLNRLVPTELADLLAATEVVPSRQVAAVKCNKYIP